jgi:hypothetical protein
MVLPRVNTLTKEIGEFLTVEKWSLSLVARLNDGSIADGITSYGAEIYTLSRT